MTQVWMGRRYRENATAAKAALEGNKDKLEAAMDEALKKVEASGREVGAEIAARRTCPAPGRIGSKIKRPAPPKADSLVETVVAAMPAARFVGIVDVEPERVDIEPVRHAPGVILPPGPPMWYEDRGPGLRPLLLTAGCKLEHVDPAKLIRR